MGVHSDPPPFIREHFLLIGNVFCHPPPTKDVVLPSVLMDLRCLLKGFQRKCEHFDQNLEFTPKSDFVARVRVDPLAELFTHKPPAFGQKYHARE